MRSFISIWFFLIVIHATAQPNTPTTTGHQTKNTLTVASNFSKLRLIALPRPNSGTFSYRQAEERKAEIYNLQPTSKYFDWKNPASGGAVHINRNDEIEVYQFTTGIYQRRCDSGIFYSKTSKDTFIVLKDMKELLYYVGGVGEGNPAGVLITSEISLTRSVAIKRLMKELWVPGVQIYYLTKMEIDHQSK
jgi:hypothetical protein